MQQGNMLIDRCCGLRAAVAIHVLEIKGRTSMIAEGAFECRTAIHWFRCVISHICNRSPSTCPGLEQ
jgi:hypothetical protein